MSPENFLPSLNFTNEQRSVKTRLNDEVVKIELITHT